jgi:hypothetical protein
MKYLPFLFVYIFIQLGDCLPAPQPAPARPQADSHDRRISGPSLEGGKLHALGENLGAASGEVALWVLH